MLDLKEDCSVSEDQLSIGSSSSNSNNSNIINPSTPDGVLKRCSDCQTTTTPLWRGGPAGPKSLCNACGIKFHKRRRALLGLDKGKVEKSSSTKKKSKISSVANSNNNANNTNGSLLKIKVIASGIRQKESLEVEQAAKLLMALSYGSVYA